MLTRLTNILLAIITTAVILKPIAGGAEPITIPVFFDYQQLKILMMQDEFKGPNGTAQYLLDDTGCTSITFSDPQLSAEGELMRADAKILATVGIPTTGACMATTRWTFTQHPAVSLASI